MLIKYYGTLSLAFLRHVESLTFLFLQTLYWIVIGPFKQKPLRKDHLLEQMVFVGVKSIAIILLVNGFMGMIMAMQSAYLLKKFGAIMYTGSLVGISFTRELGPLFAAIIMAGRVGSAMTAELGTMKVSEEIDALQVMGIDPVRFLVVPRVLAICLMLPCLTLLADVMGMFGGFLIAVFNLNLDPALYMIRSMESLSHKDLYTGLIKSFFFAGIVGLIGCYQGLIVRGGAEGVGKATTTSVVLSIILVILADCFFTALFYFVF